MDSSVLDRAPTRGGAVEMADWADVTTKASADWAKLKAAIVTRRNEVCARIILLSYQDIMEESIGELFPP